MSILFTSGVRFLSRAAVLTVSYHDNRGSTGSLSRARIEIEFRETFTLAELLSDGKPGSRFFLKHGRHIRSASFAGHRGRQSSNLGLLRHTPSVIHTKLVGIGLQLAEQCQIKSRERVCFFNRAELMNSCACQR